MKRTLATFGNAFGLASFKPRPAWARLIAEGAAQILSQIKLCHLRALQNAKEIVEKKPNVQATF